MLKRAPAGVILARSQRIYGHQKDPRASKGSTGIKRIHGDQKDQRASKGSRGIKDQRVSRFKILKNFGLKWVAVARIGLKLGGNEATRPRIIFKPYFLPEILIKNWKWLACPVHVFDSKYCEES